MFVGDFADKAGRRPAYIGCFILYIAANIGLALQNNYAALFILRCLQSAGISTTIALGSGVVSDIATAAERGSYMGFVTAGTLLGPSVGPVIGGLLAHLILLSNAILFAGFYDVSASIPSIYEDLYDLNDLQIGLCYIPFGLGATIASILSGKLLDYNYRRLASRLGVPLHHSSRDQTDFPIEKARLQLAFPLLTIGSLTVIAFGWVLHFGVHLAAPTTILFVMGLGLTGAFNTVSTLLVDLYPGNASAATASNNFVRCLLGAGATALIDPMLNAMGRGWCFTFIAFVMLATAPLLGVVVRFGPRWRRERLARTETDGSGVKL
ncbi:hypothetical protein APSETT444_002565 [Aspergillus pseudonomiae]